MQPIYIYPKDLISACIALMPCMSTDARTREYMCGIFVENHKKDKQAFQLVATNGHTLGLARLNHADTLGGDAAPVFRGVLPTACIAWIADIKPSKAALFKLYITVDEPVKQGAMDEAVGSYQEPPLRRVHIEVTGDNGGDDRKGMWVLPAEQGSDSGWIDYERVQPYEVIQPVAAFQTAFVGNIARAVKKAYKKNMPAMAFGLSENAGSPMRIYTDVPELQYIVMPLRLPDTMSDYMAPSLSPVEMVRRMRNTLRGLDIGRVGSDSVTLKHAADDALEAVIKALRDEAMADYLKQLETKESEAKNAQA